MTAAALRVRSQQGYEPLAAHSQASSSLLQPQHRERLLAAVSAMEAALRQDDEARAARTGSGEGGSGSYYDTAAAVPAGVIYPEGMMTRDVVCVWVQACGGCSS